MTIKELREKKEMTQQEFAERLGVSMSAVRTWEKGRSPSKSTRKLIRLVFGVDISGG